MRLEVEEADEMMERLSQWRPFFALLPRKVAPKDVRWLEWIERRGVFRFSIMNAGYDWWWEYRAAAGKSAE